MSQRPTQNVLLASDCADLTRLVMAAMAARGIRAEVARSLSSARTKVARGQWELVLVDPSALDGDVCPFVGGLKSGFPDLPVAAVGAAASVDEAVRAMRAGCCDVLPQPVSRQALDSLLATLLPSHEVAMAACGADGRGRHEIVGRSAALLETLRIAGRLAPTSMPVLITGESGTGKELIADYIRSRGRRAEGTYIRVNCAAMSESLLESELFGHERGAFTGAIRQRRGLFERASGGTLLLDEISETPRAFQAKLLRVLEQQDFERVGGSEMVRVDVRVISTSNRDLAAEVRGGGFRRDLYYRLSVGKVSVAPLRERADDIEPLVWHFVNQYAGQVHRRIARIDPEMLSILASNAWPGNIRQLRNVVRTALAMGQGEVLALSGVEDLSDDGARADDEGGSTLRLRHVEREAILEALRRTNAHCRKAADLLGITDRTLREKVRRYRREGHSVPAGESRWLTETA